jgi:hypothetical protein
MQPAAIFGQLHDGTRERFRVFLRKIMSRAWHDARHGGSIDDGGADAHPVGSRRSFSNFGKAVLMNRFEAMRVIVAVTKTGSSRRPLAG